MMRMILLLNWGLGLEILKVLHRHEESRILQVITQYAPSSPDAWHNAVYETSLSYGYDTLRQDQVSFEQMRETILKREVDLLLVHAFMKILPAQVFHAPAFGSLNIHPSLLPKYRGPSSTYWVLKNRERETGLTCHYIDEGIDTGAIICQTSVPVDPGDTVETIIEKQKLTVEPLLHEALRRIKTPAFQAIPQREEDASYAPRPSQSQT